MKLKLNAVIMALVFLLMSTMSAVSWSSVAPWIVYKSNGRIDPVEAVALEQIVNKYADKYGIPSSIIHRVISSESSYNERARNGPSLGMMQVNPKDHPSTMRGKNPYDPEVSINAGAQYLSECFSQFRTWPRALTCYNRGAGGVGTSRTSTYAKKVLSVPLIPPKRRK